ncbi:MAG TPA: tRNA uridine-5-carboxymethylaminomethyl(34) synthesis GTPase MnmE [Elusimicrobia bacterium]|nr:tRNA uridine-5-carboxymethylaminomethyl(34) synthesis GTPase MnmE [Elusimicrobiota bacterium]
MKIYSEDTIVSISTPLGENGIGIVRLSGNTAAEIAGKIFRPKDTNISLDKTPTHKLHYGHISSNGTVIDEVLVSVMRAPKTYTREDVVEINCHGGIVPLTKVLELCLKNGARLAQPGEFTQRAFLNGRIDLAQAEAVCDLIRAKTELASKIALQQLEGTLSQKIKTYREELINLLAHLEVSLDYIEEDIEFLSLDEIEDRVTKILSQIEKLLESADTGKILREGLKTAIVGKPNVGKSSLLNFLLREERAIVTPLPGTTRDIIEETVNLRGIPLVIIDTAGIREHSQDLIEKIGIERSKKTIEKAELILFVIDLSQPLSKEDIYIAKLINEFNPQVGADRPQR